MKLLYIGRFSKAAHTLRTLHLRNVKISYLHDSTNRHYTQKYKYDIVVCDIEGAFQDIICPLLEVRDKNPKCVIVLTSSKKIGTKHLIKAPAFHFPYHDLEKKLPILCEWLYHQKQPSSVVFRLRKHHMIALFKDEIVYISVSGHDVTIQTFDDTIFLTNSLKNVLRIINDPLIIQIEKGIAVNVRFIKEIGIDYVILEDDTILQLGKTFQKELKSKFKDYHLSQKTS